MTCRRKARHQLLRTLKAEVPIDNRETYYVVDVRFPGEVFAKFVKLVRRRRLRNWFIRMLVNLRDDGRAVCDGRSLCMARVFLPSRLSLIWRQSEHSVDGHKVAVLDRAVCVEKPPTECAGYLIKLPFLLSELPGQ